MGLGAVVSLLAEPAIEVVLPTYNGAVYLEEQVASIAAQSLRPRRLLIRDDGSSDGTLPLIARLQQRYGNWIVLLPSDNNLGCVGNVNQLLLATTAPYVALADQDDRWFPQKLQESLRVIRERERCDGEQQPALVHSDLLLMDAEGQLLPLRYSTCQRLDLARDHWLDLGLTNVVTGCSVLVNRACLQWALPLPDEALMHDWWLALVAAAQGSITCLPQPQLAYRQHAGNVLGARGTGVGVLVQKLRVPRGQRPRARLHAMVRQLRALHARCDGPHHPVVQLLAVPRWRRWWALCRLNPLRPGLTKHGPLRTLAGWGVLLLARAVPSA
jgi:hypothetical protein